MNPWVSPCGIPMMLGLGSGLTETRGWGSSLENEAAENLKRWVQCWQKAGPEMEALRRRDWDTIDLPVFFESMEDAFASSRLSAPPRASSGLIEQQDLFQRARR